MKPHTQQRKGLKPGTPQKRVFSLRSDPPSVDIDSRRATLSFSSEMPVDMWFGDEILSHAPGAMRQGVRQKTLPLLFNHNRDDLLGIVETIEIGADRRGYAQVRFSNDDRGEWALQRVADGVLVNVSFMYRVFKYEEDMETETFTATDWEPYEISLVTVPADASVGVGRSFSAKGKTMYATDELDRNEQSTRSERRRARATAEERQHFEAEERLRCAEIIGMCRHHKVESLGDQLIADGASVAEARGAVLEVLRQRNPQKPLGGYGPSEIGMGGDEARSFSLVRAINAMATNDWRKAGLERAASDAVARQIGRDPDVGGFFVPLDALMSRAAYAVGTAGAGTTGGTLVATNLLADNFIELLRNRTRVIELGATVLPGLVGNVDIPRQSGAAATGWVAENGALSETEGTFDKVSLSPKTVGTFSKISRNMLLQSTPAIEMVVRSDLAAQLALAIDLAAISGPGSGNQPTGILSTSGIGQVVGGTNGATLTFDHLLSLHAAVMNVNADRGSLGFMLNGPTIAWLSKAKATTGQYLWNRQASDQPLSPASSQPGAMGTGRAGDFQFAGFPVAVSNQLRSTLTKGAGTNLSELLFGNWSDLIIGEWGTFEIVVNPYETTAYQQGAVLVRAMQTIDIAVRHPASFAVMSDAQLA